MSDSSSEEEPKLIIDEDWKTQVQREKEELKHVEDSVDETDEAKVSDTTGEGELPPPPPATFSFLVTTLASQAMAALGQIPGDDGKPLPVNLDYARHFIDLIDTLEQKTKGNLDEEEKQFVEDTLHQMRMMFVAIKQQQST